MPFGFGLSYTTFSYAPAVPAAVPAAVVTVSGCGVISVRVRVTNTGAVDGDEVVQCYVTQRNASAPVPRVRLASFRRVAIAAGATVELTLTVAPELRSTVLSNDAAHFYDPAGNVVLEPGELDVFVGGGQPAHFAGGVRTTVSVTGAPLPLASCA